MLNKKMTKSFWLLHHLDITKIHSLPSLVQRSDNERRDLEHQSAREELEELVHVEKAFAASRPKRHVNTATSCPTEAEILPFSSHFDGGIIYHPRCRP